MPYKFLKPATRAFYNEARKLAGFSFWKIAHGYFYARFPYFYIGIGCGEHPLVRILRPFKSFLRKIFGNSKNLKNEFAESYHGKVLPLKQAKKIVTVNQDIELGDLKKVIPYSKARNLILRNPDHLVVLECPCRTSRKNPCLPLEVCIIIGEPFTGLILEHHPDRSRPISQVEAVEILQAAAELGHVHNAFFKDVMLNRFYAICNCCSCCCGAMQALRNDIPMLASSGFLIKLDVSLCAGCSMCARVCHFGAVEMIGGKPVFNDSLCMGCGVCSRKCRQGALTLIPAQDKGELLDLDKLLEKRGC